MPPYRTPSIPAFGRCLLVGLAAVGLAVVTTPTAFAQTPAGDADAPEGIPVDNADVRRACGSCHRADADGRMTRISGRRTTPEGWQQTIRRMVLLSDIELDPATARRIVKYLADHHGLAPDEAAPAAFEVERRPNDHRYAADPETETTCIQCHSMGRVISQRRTTEEWELLMAMHLGYYPLADFQALLRSGEPVEPDADGEVDERDPMDKAVAHLARAFPLETTAWSEWSANMRSPRLDGEWLLTGTQTGRGSFYGRVRITATRGAPDEFETEITYRFANDNTAIERTGDAIVYTGFQWRGRSVEGAGPDADDTSLREVLFVDRDWSRLTGRWFTGAYDETGLDVTLTRVGTEPAVVGVTPRSVPLSAGTAELRLHGANLTGIAAGDVSFGTGVEVLRVVSAEADGATVEIRVDPAAAVATRDLTVGRAALADAVVLYDRVQAVRVTPQTGMARVGGVVLPKQFQQFEARAYHHGPDGEPRTDDDLDLGLADVEWSVEEYAATYGDNDIAFVGALDDRGLFTPAADGPNPERIGNRNNVGDVWVVATLRDGRPPALRGRAHLLVTVPLYLRWTGEPTP